MIRLETGGPVVEDVGGTMVDMLVMGDNRSFSLEDESATKLILGACK